MNALTARRVTVDPTLPLPSWQRDAIEHHLLRAREDVRTALVIGRQMDHHAIYMNDDDLIWARERILIAARDARRHIAEAIRAGWRRNTRRAA